MKKIVVAPPTKEQIERWTPAPFEPVQLLGICEWEKTSFTGRLAALPDGQHFIVAGSRVLLWSIGKSEPDHVFLDVVADDNEHAFLSLDVAPDGKWFVVGDSKGMVRVWNLEDRKEIASKKLGTTGIQWLAISPDGQEIATISYTSEVTTSNPTTLEQRKKFTINTNGLKRIEYMAPQKLAVAGESTSLWDTGTGEVIQELSPGRYSFSLGLSPDGSRFIVGGNDSLRIWNVTDSKQEAEITKGVSGSELLAFSPDGKFLATTNGRSIVLWSLAERRAVQIIDSFGWPIVDVQWLPKTDLLLVASDIGLTRVWGTAKQGAAVGLKPLHSPVEIPGENFPATRSQTEQIIDLRTFPRLPGIEPTMVSLESFQGVASVKSDEVHTFYAYFLGKAGWTESGRPRTNPTAIEFSKDKMTVSVQCYDSGDGKTNVMVHNEGNYNLQLAPRFDAAPVETVYESPNSVSYKTKADLVQIETLLMRKLHAAGWTGYSRLKSSHGERPDERDLSFLGNGTTLRVSIGRLPANPDSFNIQYSLFPNNASVPIPPDAGFAEFDGSTDPTLVAVTKQSLEQSRDFYTKALTADGWIARTHGNSETEGHFSLSFIRNQSDVSIGLTKLPDGRTLVRVGDIGGSLWELSQKKEEAGEGKTDAGLEAADFPVLNGSAKFDPNDKSIEVTIEKSTLAQAAEQFTKALDKLGWKIEDGGIRAEDYTLLTYKKGKQEIALRARPKDGSAVVNFQGDGLLWKKELPTGKQTVSYEAWLRQNKLPASIEYLDRFETEMRALNAKP